MFWKLCQSFLNWFSSTGCVDNRSFKKLNYNGTSGPFSLSTQCFSTWWYLLAFGFYFLLSSIVSRQKINDMPLGCTHLEPLLQHPSPDRSQDSRLGFFSKDLFPIGFRRTYIDIYIYIYNYLWMAFYGHVIMLHIRRFCHCIYYDILCNITEGSLEVKLPTIWTDEKQRWEESEKRREEKRREGKRREGKRREEKRRSKRESLRRKKIQVREKVGKSRNIVFFQWFVAPEGRKVKSRLAKGVRSHVVRWEMKSCTPLWR